MAYKWRGYNPNHLHPTRMIRTKQCPFSNWRLGGEDLLVRGAFDLLGLGWVGLVGGWVGGWVGALRFASLVLA